MANIHQNKLETIRTGFCVVGGGMAGICAALASARRGLDTVLVTDRPVLGGNASKEIRVWVNGADGGANNRWFRETGIIEEFLLENRFRNPEGNAEVWDTVLAEAVLGQRNLRTFFNTPVSSVGKAGRKISWVEGNQLATERRFRFSAGFFADCTGDGTVAALAGARCMRGRESRSRFGESFAPAKATPTTMGGTILFSTLDAGHPVSFTPPAWAHKFNPGTFRFRNHPTAKAGCSLWWAEYGGGMDTIRDNERIRAELLAIVNGIWDYLKNSPRNRARNRNLQLEWIGTMPGKRDNRRVIGDHILTQGDVVDRPLFSDAVAFGGWSLDDHPSDGFYSRRTPSFHHYLPGIYNIPLRSLYSRDVPNLFLAGRDASLSHVALSTTRVMATCGQMGEAAAAAAVMATRKRTTPRAIATGSLAGELQQDLLRSDHYIIGVRGCDRGDLAQQAVITASSQRSASLAFDGRKWWKPGTPLRLMFPATGGRLDSVSLWVKAHRPVALRFALYGTERTGLYLPGPRILSASVKVPAGGRRVDFPLGVSTSAGFHFLEVQAPRGVSFGMSEGRLPGVCTNQWYQKNYGGNWINRHSKWGWPLGNNLAFACSPAQHPFAPEAVVNGWPRPFITPNAWISGPGFPQWLKLAWSRPVKVREVHLKFDSDLDQAMETLWVHYKSRVMPSLIRDYRLVAETPRGRRVVAQVAGNRHRFHVHSVGMSVSALRLEALASNGSPDARLYEVRVY